MNQNINKRVFIVGCPRSGTTLLQTLLLQHTKIISFPESHFFVKSLYYPKDRKQRRAAASNLKRWYKILKETGYQHPKLKYSLFLKSYVKQFIMSLDINTQYNNKTIWIEKTPSHLYTIDIIQKFIPDAQFIHLIRNGEDVVASLFDVTNQYPDMWNKQYTVEKAVERYNHDISISKQYIGQDNHFYLTYDSLIKSLENVKPVYHFLDIKAPDSIKLIPANNIIRDKEKWKENNQKDEIINTQGRKFKTIFSEAEQTYIQQNILDITKIFRGICI